VETFQACHLVFWFYTRKVCVKRLYSFTSLLVRFAELNKVKMFVVTLSFCREVYRKTKDCLLFSVLLVPFRTPRLMWILTNLIILLPETEMWSSKDSGWSVMKCFSLPAFPYLKGSRLTIHRSVFKRRRTTTLHKNKPTTPKESTNTKFVFWKFSNKRKIFRWKI
jgi:hypothetical protein